MLLVFDNILTYIGIKMLGLYEKNPMISGLWANNQYTQIIIYVFFLGNLAIYGVIHLFRSVLKREEYDYPFKITIYLMWLLTILNNILNILYYI